jgi:hypothetical protein
MLRDVPGRVVIRYGVNEDPGRWGYPLLGLGYDPDISRGFPVIEAAVDHPAEGYAAFLAWIQVVRYQVLDDGGPEVVVFDRAPQLADIELPYMTFGIKPSLFDAPSIVARDVNWRAAAWLTYSTDCLMTRDVRVLCGFLWGYQLRAGVPSPTPLTPSGADEWRDTCELLRSEFPSWQFDHD